MVFPFVEVPHAVSVQAGTELGRRVIPRLLGSVGSLHGSALSYFVAARGPTIRIPNRGCLSLFYNA